MAELEATTLGPDEFFLSGRLQFDTAIAVLALTGINPQAQATLEASRDLNDIAAELGNDTPANAGTMTVLFKGGTTAAMKADVRLSASLVAQDEVLPESERIAAGILAALIDSRLKY